MKRSKLYLSLLTLLIFFPLVGFATETTGQIQFYEESSNIEPTEPSHSDVNPIKEPRAQPPIQSTRQRLAQLNDEVNLILSVIGIIFLGFSIIGILRRKLS